ncbi:hypothetical protein X777_09289, partial [Ooceraea biroi]
RSNHPFSRPKPPGSYGNIPCIACGYISDCYITKSVLCTSGCCIRYIRCVPFPGRCTQASYKRSSSRSNAPTTHFNNNNSEPFRYRSLKPHDFRRILHPCRD